MKGYGESIKEFLALGFWGSVLGVSVFVTSNDLINRGYKTECVILPFGFYLFTLQLLRYNQKKPKGPFLYPSVFTL